MITTKVFKMKWNVFIIIFEGLSLKQIKKVFFGRWVSDFKYFSVTTIFYICNTSIISIICNTSFKFKRLRICCYPLVHQGSTYLFKVSSWKFVLSQPYVGWIKVKIYSLTYFSSPYDDIFLTGTENKFIDWYYCFLDSTNNC